MRQDQYERMQALSEKLTDVFLSEADSDKWPGSTTPIDQQDKTVRGDRYWFKKNAVATVALIIRTHTLIGQIQRASDPLNKANGSGGEVTPEPQLLDEEIAEHELSAQVLMDQLRDPKNKKRFDKMVHGSSKP